MRCSADGSTETFVTRGGAPVADLDPAVCGDRQRNAGFVGGRMCGAQVDGRPADLNRFGVAATVSAPLAIEEPVLCAGD